MIIEYIVSSVQFSSVFHFKIQLHTIFKINYNYNESRKNKGDTTIDKNKLLGFCKDNLVNQVLFKGWEK